MSDTKGHSSNIFYHPHHCSIQRDRKNSKDCRMENNSNCFHMNYMYYLMDTSSIKKDRHNILNYCQGRLLKGIHKHTLHRIHKENMDTNCNNLIHTSTFQLCNLNNEKM